MCNAPNHEPDRPHADRIAHGDEEAVVPHHSKADEEDRPGRYEIAERNGKGKGEQKAEKGDHQSIDHVPKGNVQEKAPSLFCKAADLIVEPEPLLSDDGQCLLRDLAVEQFGWEGETEAEGALEAEKGDSEAKENWGAWDEEGLAEREAENDEEEGVSLVVDDLEKFAKRGWALVSPL